MPRIQCDWLPVAARHGRWLVSRFGRGSFQVMLNTLAVAFVAVCVPWIIRFELLSAFVLIPLACLSVFLVADLIVDSFITYPHGVSRKEFTGRVFACVMLGWALGLTILTTALAGLNAQNWTGELLLPDTATVIDAGVLSLAASVLVAAIAVRVTWKASTAGPAKLTLKLVLMLATVISIYACTHWQTDGSFVITSQTIHWVSWFFAVALFGAGLTLLILPTRLRQ